MRTGYCLRAFRKEKVELRKHIYGCEYKSSFGLEGTTFFIEYEGDKFYFNHFSVGL